MSVTARHFNLSGFMRPAEESGPPRYFGLMGFAVPEIVGVHGAMAYVTYEPGRRLFVYEPGRRVFVYERQGQGGGMYIIDRVPISAGATLHYGIDILKVLTDLRGNAVAVSGTPTVTGTNCTATHLLTDDGIIEIEVTPTLNAGSRARAVVEFDLDDGEHLPCALDFDVV